jgi:ABC-type lipoprotein export system ATPase subunit
MHAGVTTAGATAEAAPPERRERPLRAGQAAPPVPVLAAEDLHLAYRRGSTTIEVLRSAAFTAGPGEVLAVVGRSGSGKSSLLHVAGLLAVADRGRVVLEGMDLTGIDARGRAEWRRRRIGFVFQTFQLLGGLSAAENVALPLVLDGQDRRQAIERARLTLHSVGLAARADHRPSELSGGEAQRVAIARALVGRPSVVLADEPTGSLDATSATEVLDVLTEQVRERACTTVIVTHDPTIAERADRVLEMRDGVLV